MTRFVILTMLLLMLGCARSLKQPYSIETPASFATDLQKPVDELWQNKLKAYPNQVMFLNDSLLLIGDSRGGLTTFNINTGDRTDRYWRPLKRPVQLYDRLGSVLYFTAESERDVIAWDLQHAEQLWKIKLDIDYSDMIAVDSMLYAISDSSAAKIDAQSADLLKTIPFETKLIKGVAYAEDKIYFCSESGELFEFDQHLDRLDQMDLDLPMVHGLQQHRDRLIVYNSQASIRIVDLKKFAIEFSTDLGEPLYAAPRVAHDLLIVPFATGTVTAYSMTDASPAWRFSGKSLLNLDLLITDHNIILVYARGQVVSLNPKTGEKQWQYDHDESLTFAALTQRGILLGHRREIFFIGEKHER